MNERIFLIGYRGCGKSTVGPILARNLGWDFVDMDPLIEQRAGKTIRQIFAESGESAFRRMEHDMLVELRELPRRVIATGGGAPVRYENSLIMRNRGFVAWLKASVETIWVRIQADATTTDRRPNLAGGGRKEIEDVLAKRLMVYESAAHFSLDVDGLFPEQAADRILEAWLSFSSSSKSSP